MASRRTGPPLAVKVQLRDINPDGYRPHFLHAADNDWLESNCATDMWIETLHSLGLDPVAAFRNSDAYTFFERLGDAVVTGPTGNNLRDLRILLAEP